MIEIGFCCTRRGGGGGGATNGVVRVVIKDSAFVPLGSKKCGRFIEFWEERDWGRHYMGDLGLRKDYVGVIRSGDIYIITKKEKRYI